MIKISGYDHYWITPEGRVFSEVSNKWLSQGLNKKNGYLYVSLWKENVGMTLPVHRLVAEYYVLNPENKPVVNHKNGIKTYNFSSNLEWVTKLENEQHARDTGLRIYTNRLTREEFLEVLDDVINGESYASVCERVPYKVPFLSTKIKQFATETGRLYALQESLKEQRRQRAMKNLESVNQW